MTVVVFLRYENRITIEKTVEALKSTGYCCNNVSPVELVSSIVPTIRCWLGSLYSSVRGSKVFPKVSQKAILKLRTSLKKLSESLSFDFFRPL